MKIVLIRHECSMTIPTLNSSVEALVTMLLKNYEQDSNCEHQFYLIQNGDKIATNKIRNNFQKTNFVFIKYDKRRNLFTRVINKFFRYITKNHYENFIANSYYREVFKTVKEINPDIIIFENYKDPLLKKYVKFFGKNKLFYHVHSDLTGKIIFNLPREVGLIAVSDFVRKSFLAHNQHKNLLSYVLPNCANDKTFLKQITESERVALREKFGFNKEDFVVVYCGRMIPIKGILQLIQAVLRAPQNIKLLIIGGILKNNQSIQTKFITEVNQLVMNNAERIKFTGYINNEDLYKYYQCADLQVVPTLTEEAAGMVVIEGQMSGLPQIITRSGGMVEYATKDTVVLERDDKLVENLTNAIVNLSTNEARLNIMRKSAKQNTLKYTRKSYYENFLQIIYSIAKKQAESKDENGEK